MSTSVKILITVLSLACLISGYFGFTMFLEYEKTKARLAEQEHQHLHDRMDTLATTVTERQDSHEARLSALEKNQEVVVEQTVRILGEQDEKIENLRRQTEAANARQERKIDALRKDLADTLQRVSVNEQLIRQSQVSPFQSMGGFPYGYGNPSDAASRYLESEAARNYQQMAIRQQLFYDAAYHHNQIYHQPINPRDANYNRMMERARERRRDHRRHH